MKSVTITSLTAKGSSALRQHYEESRKIRLVHKIQFKAMGYKQTVVTEEPFTLRIEITNQYFRNVLEPKQFTKQINKAMKDNGANKEDYKLEVE